MGGRIDEPHRSTHPPTNDQLLTLGDRLGVDALRQELLRLPQQLPAEHRHGRRPVAHLVVLRWRWMWVVLSLSACDIDGLGTVWTTHPPFRRRLGPINLPPYTTTHIYTDDTISTAPHLRLGDVHQHLGRRVVDVHGLEDGGPVVRHRDGAVGGAYLWGFVWVVDVCGGLVLLLLVDGDRKARPFGHDASHPPHHLHPCAFTQMYSSKKHTLTNTHPGTHRLQDLVHALGPQRGLDEVRDGDGAHEGGHAGVLALWSGCACGEGREEGRV